MVKISVDEGYAFDILSIFEVKINNCDDPKKIEISGKAFELLRQELEAQLGSAKLLQIMNSVEYHELYNENKKTFLLVDKIRASNEVSLGKDIDKNNLSRFECKRKLQNKFFDSQMLETKTKYE